MTSEEPLIEKEADGCKERLMRHKLALCLCCCPIILGTLWGVFDLSLVPNYDLRTCATDQATHNISNKQVQSTSGTCSVTSCLWNRGPTSCIEGACVCPGGYCSTGPGCILKSSDITPVNGTGPNNKVLMEVHSMINSTSPFPKAHQGVKTAICFSGGGMRSLSLAEGQLRALYDMKVMEHVDAISGVSGGSWASSIYMFSKASITELLGSQVALPALTMDALRSEPPLLGQAAVQLVSTFYQHLITRGALKSEIWEEFVEDVVMKHLPHLGHRGVAMFASEAQRKRILKDNVESHPELKDISYSVPSTTDHRPKVFVMLAAVLAPTGHKIGTSHPPVVGLQMSPDYTGIPYYPTTSGKVEYLVEEVEPSLRGNVSAVMPLELSSPVNHYLGGGLVETFGYGGEAPTGKREGKVAVPMHRHLFNLLRALTLSSFAPAAKLVNLPQAFGAFAPKGTYWPIVSADKVDEPEAKASEYSLGDGGIIENAGLLPMLQRGAEKVIWFINTDTAIASKESLDFCDESALTSKLGSDGAKNILGLITNQFTDKFGYGTDSTGGYLARNTVFTKADFQIVACELQTLVEAGKPATYKHTHALQHNPWWNIQGGRDVTVVYVYHAPSTEFVNKLPQDTQAEIGKGADGSFPYYPYFKTVGEISMTHLTQYKNEQTNLLAAHSEYAVKSLSADIKELFAGTGSK